MIIDCNWRTFHDLLMVTTHTGNNREHYMFFLTFYNLLSYVTSIETKLRNRLSTDVLDTILRIRTSLYFSDKCCKDFIVTKQMIDLFKLKEGMIINHLLVVVRTMIMKWIHLTDYLEYHRYRFFRDLFVSPVPTLL